MQKMDLAQMMLDYQEIPFPFEMAYYVKGYHAYQNIWTPVVGESLTSEREKGNPKDKYAVCDE